MWKHSVSGPAKEILLKTMVVMTSMHDIHQITAHSAYPLKIGAAIHRASFHNPFGIPFKNKVSHPRNIMSRYQKRMHATYTCHILIAWLPDDSAAAFIGAWAGRFIATSRLRAIKFFGYLPLQRSFENKYCQSPNIMAQLQNGGDPKRILTMKP